MRGARTVLQNLRCFMELSVINENVIGERGQNEKKINNGGHRQNEWYCVHLGIHNNDSRKIGAVVSVLPLNHNREMSLLLNSNCCGNFSIRSCISSTSKLDDLRSHGRYRRSIKTLNTLPTDGNHRPEVTPSSKTRRNFNFGVVPIVTATAATSLVLAHSAHAESMENIMGGATSIYNLADGGAGDWFGGLLYSAGQQANEAVLDQLSALSFTSLAVIFGAGLVTSLSPCTLSVLPLTLGYIGAFGSGKSRSEVIGNSIAFSLGLATTLAILGIAASFAGKAYGQIGQGLPVASSTLAIFMGLNLLEIIELQLPSFFNNFDPRDVAANFPPSVQAYLAGLTFALAASPCSTPVLATLLGYVATSKDPLIGGSLLLTYTTGYIAPLLLAASFAGALQSLLSFRKFSAWINPTSGALLLGGGVYTMLDKLFPMTSMSM